ncbi:hypothetical protein, partial [Sodalis sp.]|uniref:hypothetical protein n=1 Tax=Sodalis sp. (in: enterobacteria) TaxID=1898979 RepID=UPI0038733666
MSTISTNTSPSLFWKKIQRISGKFIDYQPALLINERVEQNFDLLAEHFAEFYTSIYSSPTQLTPEDKDYDNTNIHTEKAYNLPLTKAELIASIKELKPSSPGVDDIHNMLKNLPKPAPDALLAFYNHAWCKGDFPKILRRSIIIPILKPGKNKLAHSNYQPISLTSCVGKLLEKMIFKRLARTLGENRLLSDTQCGFRTGRFTIDHLLTMEYEIL